MAGIHGFIQKLQEQRDSRKHIAAYREVPPREASYKKVQPPLPGPLMDYLASRQDMKLYSHQGEVIEKIREGQNVVIVTSTASGKSLAFNLPVLESLWKDPRATALYLYPLKALAYDQLKELKEVERETGLSLKPAVYDGDTPRLERGEIRQQSRLVLSNPHALHCYLPWHRLWRRFFSRLKYIVIDEGHWYRGIFGSNVAFFIRRLRRVLHHYGADPRFILASATMADPVEHGERLTGEKFVLVGRDGSQQGKRNYLFWDTSQDTDRSPHFQVADLFRASVEEGLQTLCFTVSRKMAELTARWAGEGRGDIASYRAGYLPEDRRELEKGFKEGRLRGIASTNALELGVNIGGLDAVIIGGYPGTLTSFHQRAGRAGRSRQEALVLQLLFDNPLDAYIQANPDYLFQEPVEQAVISLENRYILKNHLLCAGEELSLGREDEAWFGEGYVEGVRELIREGSLVLEGIPGQKPKRGKDRRYLYPREGACFQVSLSSFDNEGYQLVSGDRVLETLSRRQAWIEAHPGAVFLHMTRPYRVKETREKERIILVEPEESDFYTTALSDTFLSRQKNIQTNKQGNLQLYYSQVEVTEKVHSYLLKKYDRVVNQVGLDLGPIELATMAVGVEIPLDEIKGSHDGGLHGAEHLLIAVTPLLAMCDRWDIGGVSLQEKERGFIYIYDAFPGGIGISCRLFHHFGQLVSKAREVAGNCNCHGGCPRCIMSPKCGNNNEPLDKSATIEILEYLARQFR